MAKTHKKHHDSKHPKPIIWTIIGCFLAFIALLIAFVWILVVTSKPTFTVAELEDVVHTAVNDYTASMSLHDDTYFYNQAVQMYDPLVINGGATQSEILDVYHLDMKMKLIHQRLLQKYPGRILQNPTWAFQECGSIWCKQLIMLCNFREYVCLWSSTSINNTSIGFSGAYGGSLGKGFLNEGDVMISGHMESCDPEPELAVARYYEFGQTSYLNPGRRRVYSLSKNCAMLSFGLHDGSNMLKTFFPGLIIPYLCQNNDTLSFKIQMKDAITSMYMWIKYRLFG